MAKETATVILGVRPVSGTLLASSTDKLVLLGVSDGLRWITVGELDPGVDQREAKSRANSNTPRSAW